MSNSLVRYAVAAAITASAMTAVHTAHATDISTYSQHTNINVYISGSTAVDNTINGLLTGSLGICAPGTTNFYLDGKNVLDANGHVIGGGQERLWYCQAGTASGVKATNAYLAVFKESTAGSINGAAPLIAVAKGGSSGLTFFNVNGPDLDNTNCAGGANAGSACTAADFTHGVAPTGGVADVEASILRAIDGSALAPSDISTYLSGSAGFDVVWGVAVTKNLFYALQHAEGLDNGSVTSACNTANNDAPACAPSLSKQQVASLLLGPNNNNGNLLTWNQFIVGPNNATLNNTSDNNVYICRRDVGSGTEASFEAYFLGARCSSSSEAMAKEDGTFVIESASTGNIMNCLEAFDKGNVEIVPYSGDQVQTFPAFTPAGNQWAIGITSTELNSTDVGPTSAYSDTVRLVAVDGVLPTLENVTNGFYPYFSTDSWYTIASGNGVPSGDALKVFQDLLADAGAPATLASADANYKNNPWGDGGDLASASNWATSSPVYTTMPVTSAEVEANPVNLWTKASGGSVDNCDTPVLYGNIGSGLAQSTVVEGSDHGSNNVNNH